MLALQLTEEDGVACAPSCPKIIRRGRWPRSHWRSSIGGMSEPQRGRLVRLYGSALPARSLVGRARRAGGHAGGSGRSTSMSDLPGRLCREHGRNRRRRADRWRRSGASSASVAPAAASGRRGRCSPRSTAGGGSAAPKRRPRAGNSGGCRRAAAAAAAGTWFPSSAGCAGRRRALRRVRRSCGKRPDPCSAAVTYAPISRPCRA